MNELDAIYQQITGGADALPGACFPLGVCKSGNVAVLAEISPGRQAVHRWAAMPKTP